MYHNVSQLKLKFKILQIPKIKDFRILCINVSQLARVILYLANCSLASLNLRSLPLKICDYICNVHNSLSCTHYVLQVDWSCSMDKLSVCPHYIGQVHKLKFIHLPTIDGYVDCPKARSISG